MMDINTDNKNAGNNNLDNKNIENTNLENKNLDNKSLENKNLDIRTNISLEASAGTGKTFQLSLRIISMLIQGISPSNILALTFTKKATGEMQERVVSQLTKLATTPDTTTTEYKMLSEVVKGYATRNKIEFSDKLVVELANKALDRLLREFSSLNIKTIDSYSSLILKLFPFEASIRPDYDTLSTGDNERLEDEVFEHTIDDILNNETWKDILRKSIMVLRSSNRNILNLVKSYVLFVNENSFNLSKSIKNIDMTIKELDLELAKVLSFRLEILDDFKNLGSLFDDILEGDRKRKQIDDLINSKSPEDIFNLKLFADYDLINNHAWFKKYSFKSSQIDKHRDVLDKIKLYLSMKERIAINLSLLLGSYFINNLQRAKSRENALTYNDITYLAYRILHLGDKNIDRDYLYFRLDSKISHILIDEFQDTSHMQWEILEPLILEAMAGIGQKDRSGSFFYVGDPKQNLYRFRGSNSDLFLSVYNKYSDRIDRESLERNFRSSQSVVDFVNLVSNKLADYFPNIEQLDVFRIDQKVTDNAPLGFVKSVVIEESDYEDEVISQIEFLISKGYNYSDIAILLPTNDNISSLNSVLKLKNIPTVVETSLKLNNDKTYLMLSNLIKAIYFKDVLSFLNYVSIFDISTDMNKYSNLDKVYAIINSLREEFLVSTDVTVFEVILKIVDKKNLYSNFKNDMNFFTLLDVISIYLANESNPSRFLAELERLASGINISANSVSSGVLLMTINKSKGLQFKVVMLPKLELSFSVFKSRQEFFMCHTGTVGESKLIFNHGEKSRVVNDEFDLFVSDERKRIIIDSLNKLYVGMTRAEEVLILFSLVQKSRAGDINNVKYLLPEISLGNYQSGELVSIASTEVKIEKSTTESLCYPEIGDKIEQPFEEVNIDYVSSQLGEFLHAVLYFVDDLDDIDNVIDYALSSAINSVFIDISDEYIDCITDIVKRLVKDDSYRSFYKGKVFKESKFVSNNKLVRVDFYSVFDDEIILVDYKSSKNSFPNIDRYKTQLNTYSSILEEVYDRKVRPFIILFNILERTYEIRNIV